MTNRILLLKKIALAAAIALLMAGNANADCVYDTDFTAATTTYVTSTGAHVLGGGGTLAAGDWFGSSQTPGVGSDVLTLDVALNASGFNDNRYRGAGVWLDASQWATGPVTVEVDVTSYTAGTDGATTFFQAYAANGVDASNSVSLDLHAGPAPGAILGQTGTAAISALGSEQLITGTGTDVSFTFNYNGTDQFVGLVFANRNPNTTPNGNIGATAVLDNLKVNTASAVPEPSSLALLAAGFGMIGLRRRRLK